MSSYLIQVFMLTISPSEINPCKRSRKLLQFFSSATTDTPRLATASLLPSGKVRVGWLPKPSVSDEDRAYEHGCIHNESDYVEYKSERTGRMVRFSVQRETAPSLGLSAIPNYHSKGKRHGLKGITSRGRENVKESAWLLQRRYGRRLGFYTLTCPYTDEESIYLFNQNIAYIQRSYFQEVKRHYEKRGIRWTYVSVLEIQTERYQNTGIPVLHIHYIAPCYVPGSFCFAISSDDIRSIWQRVLCNTIGKKEDCSSSVDSQVIRKNAGGYISKYLSKGGDSLDFLGQNAPDQFPSQWWSTSRNLRKALKSCTVKLPSHIAQEMLDGRAFDPSHIAYLQYYRYIYVQWYDNDICVGMSAQMSSSLVDNWQDFRGKLDNV